MSQTRVAVWLRAERKRGWETTSYIISSPRTRALNERRAGDDTVRQASAVTNNPQP